MRGVTNVELLHDLAESYGFGTSYRASNGLVTEPPAESFVKLLRALGLSLSDAPSDEELHFHLLSLIHISEPTRPY